MTDQDQSLRDLIEGIRFAMFTTRSRDGSIHSRPMTTQNADADAGKYLWFFMSRSSNTVDELSAEPKVNISYADPGKDAYVSVSGNARLVDDRKIKQRLWSKMNEAWFPNGIEDPDVALICVEIDESEYWNVKESKLVQIAKMTKAVLNGKRPTDMGDHAKIRRN